MNATTFYAFSPVYQHFSLFAQKISDFFCNFHHCFLSHFIVIPIAVYPSPSTHFRKKYGIPFADIREHPNTDFLTLKDYEVRTDREWRFGSRNPSVSTDMTQFFFQIEMDMSGIDQWQGEAARFTFSDIICYMREGNYAGLNQTLVKGDWMLEVPLKSTDTAVFAQAGQVISAFTPALERFYDKEITFDDDLKLYQDDVPDKCDNQYYTKGSSPILTLRNGTTFDLRQIGRSACVGNKSTENRAHSYVPCSFSWKIKSAADAAPEINPNSSF